MNTKPRIEKIKSGTFKSQSVINELLGSKINELIERENSRVEGSGWCCDKCEKSRRLGASATCFGCHCHTLPKREDMRKQAPFNKERHEMAQQDTQSGWVEQFNQEFVKGEKLHGNHLILKDFIHQEKSRSYLEGVQNGVKEARGEDHHIFNSVVDKAVLLCEERIKYNTEAGRHYAVHELELLKQKLIGMKK